MNNYDPVRDAYDALATVYDTRWRKYIDATLALTMESLVLEGRERVLDIGCGTGELERQWFKRWPALSLVGVDLSPNMLRQAAIKASRAALLAAEASRLPFAAESFDLVVCANAFHYFRLPELALAEMRRVLRPAGQVVLVDWCDDYLSCKLCSLWLRWTDRAFYRSYTLRDCQRLLKRGDFVVESAFRRRIDWLWGLMCFVARA